MKKIMTTALLSSFILFHARAQNKLSVKAGYIEAGLAKSSINKKAAKDTMFSDCSIPEDITPVKTSSSSGATGYYSSCEAGNAVIFYLVKQNIAVLNFGDIRTKYATGNFERGQLGFPVRDTKNLRESKGCYQVFETGRIYVIYHASPDKRSSAAFIIKGDFYKKFLKAGGEKVTGLPISDEEDDGSAGGEAGDKSPNGSISQSFEKGVITKKGNVLTYKSYARITVPVHTDGYAQNNKKNVPAHPGESLTIPVYPNGGRLWGQYTCRR